MKNVKIFKIIFNFIQNTEFIILILMLFWAFFAS